jgi:hypothetical protein
MRNGQVLTGGMARSLTAAATTNQSNNKEQMKNRENLLKKSEPSIDVVKKPEVEKITSFSDPVPATKITKESANKEQPAPKSPPSSPTPPATINNNNNNSNTKAIVLQSSRVASGRIVESENSNNKPSSNRSTLTRKPPVWREKPRIPIKPQTTVSINNQPNGILVEPNNASHPPGNSNNKVEPVVVVEQQPTIKTQNPADCQPGQISIRFVHLSSGGEDCAKPAPSVLPPLVPANLQKSQVVRQLSALERLDLLGSSENIAETLGSNCPSLPESSPKVPDNGMISPSFVFESLPAPEVVVAPPRTPSPMMVVPNEINNNPIKAVAPEPDTSAVQQSLPEPTTTTTDSTTSSSHKSPALTAKKAEETREAQGITKVEGFSSDCRSNSTRGLTRSAFEALRANLAGSLELSRVCQPQSRAGNSGNPKRQAPPTPLSCDAEDSTGQQPDSGPSSPPPSLASLADPVAVSSAPPTLPTSSIPPTPPPAPALPPLADFVIPKKESPPPPPEVCGRPGDRAISASPRFRNSLICTSPDGGSVAMDEEDQGHPRSVSLTRVERSDSQSMATKPPSLRKFIKERATHFLHMAEAGGSCGGSARPSGSRLSRSERFAAESCTVVGTVNGKKGKSRFSLRKLLGLKKDGGWDEPAVEPLPPKIRPEIVHPIDFHPIGQVQVVQGKIETTGESGIIGRSPAHDSISSTDSGRHSSLEMQQSDSSMGSSDCPSPVNSHQSPSFKTASLKGKAITILKKSNIMTETEICRPTETSSATASTLAGPAAPPPVAGRRRSLPYQHDDDSDGQAVASASAEIWRIDTTPARSQPIFARPEQHHQPGWQCGRIRESRLGLFLSNSIDSGRIVTKLSAVCMCVCVCDGNICFLIRSGDIRNGIMPKKPERSASLRTRERSMPYDSLELKQVCRIPQFVACVFSFLFYYSTHVGYGSNWPL